MLFLSSFGLQRAQVWQQQPPKKSRQSNFQPALPNATYFSPTTSERNHILLTSFSHRHRNQKKQVCKAMTCPPRTQASNGAQNDIETVWQVWGLKKQWASLRWIFNVRLHGPPAKMEKPKGFWLLSPDLDRNWHMPLYRWSFSYLF